MKENGVYVKSSKSIPNIIDPQIVGRIFKMMEKIENLEELEFESENSKEVEFSFDGDKTFIGFDLGGKHHSLKVTVAEAVKLRGDNDKEEVEKVGNKLSPEVKKELMQLVPLVEEDLVDWGFDQITEVELEFKGGKEIEITIPKEDEEIACQDLDCVDLRISE